MNYDRWAEVYDIIYGSYKRDIPFYVKEAGKAKGKVLELACGTGRIYLKMLEKGIDAYGIDISGGMLRALRKKARKKGLKPNLRKADMKSFRLGQKFSLIIVPFNSFLHNLTTAEQLRALKNIRRHLAPGGRLVMDFFLPSPDIIANKYGKELRESIRKDGATYTLVKKSCFADEPEQIVETMVMLKKGGRKIWKDTFTISLIYKKEFELLLSKAGFSRWKVYGGFRKQKLRSSKQQMVWVASR